MIYFAINKVKVLRLSQFVFEVHITMHI